MNTNLDGLIHGSVSDISQALPHEVTFDAAKSIKITLKRLLRAVPGRRYVFEGELDGQQKLIKCFVHPKRHKKHCEREYRSTKRLVSLTDHAVSVEQIEAGKALSVLAYEWLSEAKTLKELLPALPLDKQIEKLSSVLEVLMKLHDKGVRQRDLHLGNLLVSQAQWYLIDADTISFHDGGISKDSRRENLIVFMAQLNPLIYEHLNVFMEQFHIAGLFDSEEELLQSIWEQRKLINRRYLKKSLRKASAFDVQKLGAFRVHVDKRTHAEPQALLMRALDELQSRRQETLTLKDRGHDYQLFVGRRDDCLHLWNLSQTLVHEKIPCLKPLALFEQKRFLGRGKAAVLIESQDSKPAALRTAMEQSEELRHQWLNLCVQAYFANILPLNLSEQLCLRDGMLVLRPEGTIDVFKHQRSLADFSHSLLQSMSTLNLPLNDPQYQRLRRLSLI